MNNTFLLFYYRTPKLIYSNNTSIIPRNLFEPVIYWVHWRPATGVSAWRSIHLPLFRLTYLVLHWWYFCLILVFLRFSSLLNRGGAFLRVSRSFSLCSGPFPGFTDTQFIAENKQVPRNNAVVTWTLINSEAILLFLVRMKRLNARQHKAD